jgi:hypothetical protein
MARCQMCGAELEDASQRFCGGDRCARVFMNAARSGRGADEPLVAMLPGGVPG